MSFEPKIVAFLCNWCSYAGADLAGVSRFKYPPNVVPIKVMCSGRVDAEFIIDAFRKGADGVLIGGCHPGDCHYVEGNYKARRRVEMMKRLLKEMGINPKRLRIEWISATEGKKFASVVEEFVEEIRKLGPVKK
ncbi:MAG: hydrogenase iron-sulfur subunit [Thermoplasmatales archaeon]|nr:hydrogenase iron-sulfur subunit [Thermoplasmatales archaeon]